ncbi:hypothetical protein K490DRAFT_64166 [Saccharata proteae CBS 121410]|uniref:C2H2-type domain-containing protein n=1 Tax=Saccharata proteae CBS 121410 TaxID=1314787 RepID=A0A6A5YDC4_9PEZI|nr:hypothetical protein K490DRAFT_64166 [Saccharata proteae CBS 121410]
MDIRGLLNPSITDTEFSPGHFVYDWTDLTSYDLVKSCNSVTDSAYHSQTNSFESASLPASQPINSDFYSDSDPGLPTSQQSSFNGLYDFRSRSDLRASKPSDYSLELEPFIGIVSEKAPKPKDTTYCPWCGASFKGKKIQGMRNLKRHQTYSCKFIEPKIKRLFTCSACSKTYTRKDALLFHEQIHHPKTREIRAWAMKSTCKATGMQTDLRIQEECSPPTSVLSRAKASNGETSKDLRTSRSSTEEDGDSTMSAYSQWGDVGEEAEEALRQTPLGLVVLQVRPAFVQRVFEILQDNPASCMKRPSGSPSPRDRDGKNQNQSTSGSTSTSSTVSENKNTERTTQECKSERKRKRKSNDENLSEDETNNRLRLGAKSKQHSPRKRFFACPYLAHNQEQHSACLTYKLESSARVKFHLRRQHSASPWYCPICKEVFENADSRDKHTAEERTNCPFRSLPIWPGVMTTEQGDKLRKRTTGDDVANWYTIYDILFPQDDKPKSPYIDTILAEFTSLENLLASEGPTILRQCLDAQSTYDESVGHYVDLLIQSAWPEFTRRIASQYAQRVHQTAQSTPRSSQVSVVPDAGSLTETLLPDAGFIAENENDPGCPQASTIAASAFESRSSQSAMPQPQPADSDPLLNLLPDFESSRPETTSENQEPWSFSDPCSYPTLTQESWEDVDFGHWDDPHWRPFSKSWDG